MRIQTGSLKHLPQDAPASIQGEDSLLTQPHYSTNCSPFFWMVYSTCYLLIPLPSSLHKVASNSHVTPLSCRRKENSQTAPQGAPNQKYGPTVFGSTSVFSYSDAPCSGSELSLLCFPGDLHFPFLHFPLQGFFSPLQSAWSRLRNLVLQASKSASMLPCLLWATLQSPSTRVMMRLAPSIHSHLSMFLPTWDMIKVNLGFI